MNNLKNHQSNCQFKKILSVIVGIFFTITTLPTLFRHLHQLPHIVREQFRKIFECFVCSFFLDFSELRVKVINFTSQQVKVNLF